MCVLQPFHGGNRGSNPLGDARVLTLQLEFLIQFWSHAVSGNWDMDHGAKEDLKRRTELGAIRANVFDRVHAIAAAGLAKEV